MKIKHIVPRLFLSRSQWRALARPMLACAASGLAWRLAFPPIEWGWVAWFASVPFLAALRNRTAKEGAWLGLCFGLFLFYPNLTWLNTLSDVNPLAPLGILIVALICALFPALFGALAAPVLSRRAPGAFLLVPAIWTAQEYLRSLGELAFPWIYLGHSQVNRLALIQVCDLTGVYGVSFLVVLVNQAFADAWAFLRRRHPGARAVAIECAVAALLFALTAGYGVVALRRAPSEDPSGQAAAAGARILLVQPGVPQSVKLASYADPDPDVQRRLQDRMNGDLKGLLERIRAERDAKREPAPDLCILPESAITHPFFNLLDEEQAFARDLQRTVACPLFFGANRFELPAGTTVIDMKAIEEGRAYNSAYLADASGVRAETYDKIHLVPFGEYASYFDVIPGFTRYILGIGNFAPGRAFRAFSLPAGGSFGCVICFESCFPYLFRGFDRRDPDWMVVVTNDAWYKTSSGARRHQTQSIFRAIEMRRPIVRAANTGISCAVDPWGRTSSVLPLREGEGLYAVATVARRAGRFGDFHTIYMRRWGEWFAWLCLVVSALGVVYVIRGGREADPAPQNRVSPV